MVGIVDRRSENLGQAHGAEALERRHISAEIPRNDPGVDAPVERLRSHLFALERHRRRARHRKRIHLSGLLLVDGHEAVAADAVHLRLHHIERRADRDRRIDRVAALHQHLQPGHRRQRMSRRYQTVDARNRGPIGRERTSPACASVGILAKRHAVISAGQTTPASISLSILDHCQSPRSVRRLLMAVGHLCKQCRL